MRSLHKFSRSVAALVILLAAARAEKLILSSTFVNQVKDRATVSAKLKVDVHPNTPHSISKGGNDGDIHMAGRAEEVGLPLVAEIVNARLVKPAMTRLKATAPGTEVPVEGVWRIWFEHLGKEDQIQGDPVDVPDTSNPAHLFEIHPITTFGGDSVLDSFVDIPNYTAYPAHVAFPFYEQVKATISASDSSVTITSGAGKYNYAQFVIELAGAVQDVDDGSFVLANVFDKEDDEEAVTKEARRMVFVKDTRPACEVKKLTTGSRLHVLGIPRVNLSEVAVMATEEAAATHLPYEMIIVAVQKADLTDDCAPKNAATLKKKGKAKPGSGGE